MKSSIAAAVMVGSIATLGPAAAAGQAAWEESTFPGGMQFHLRNAEGAAIVLECVDQGIRVGFAFAAPLLATERSPCAPFPASDSTRGSHGSTSVRYESKDTAGSISS